MYIFNSRETNKTHVEMITRNISFALVFFQISSFREIKKNSAERINEAASLKTSLWYYFLTVAVLFCICFGTDEAKADRVPAASWPA